MKLNIKNFRRIKEADIEINTVTLVCGFNEQGKTSISQAAAALLTSNASVMGVTKKDSGVLVSSGEKKSEVTLRLDESSDAIHITWPDAKVHTDGIPPRASIYASGTKKYGDTDKKDAAKLLVGLLNALPTKEETVSAISLHTTPENAERTWSMIDRDGWDAAQAFFQDQCRNLKADWRAVTSDTWGAAKAASWRPANLLHDMDIRNRESLVADAERAKNHLEHCIANRAVILSNADALKEEAEKLPELSRKKKEKEAEITAIHAEIDECSKNLAAVPPITQPPAMHCPHCNEEVSLKAERAGISVLVKSSDVRIDEKQLESARLKHASLSGQLSNLKTQAGKLSMELGAINSNGKRALDARNKLKEAEAAAADGGDRFGEEAVSSAREAHKRATEALAAFDAMSKAEAIHKRIVSGLEIAELLGPEKLRKESVARRLRWFNDTMLSPLSNAFGIDTVTVDSEMVPHYKGYAYNLLSESAQFRVDCVMQAAIAKLDGSHMIVVDGADIIVGKDRSGLLNMLRKNEIPALVTMSMTTPDNCPNLSGIGGCVYWLSDCVANKLEGK